jgi:two-component system, LuxR family, response regulator FixJ
VHCPAGSGLPLGRRVVRSGRRETVASATDFLARTPVAPAACVVLDVRMPGMSGLELQQHLAETHPELPVIVISGHPSVETRERALAAGAVAVLDKPFDGQCLLDAVADALGRSGRGPTR